MDPEALAALEDSQRRLDQAHDRVPRVERMVAALLAQQSSNRFAARINATFRQRW